MGGSRSVACDRHGPQAETAVCQHIAHSLTSRRPVGFFWARSADEARPDAWCTACNERVARTDGEWVGEAAEHLGAKILCALCYDEARHLNLGEMVRRSWLEWSVRGALVTGVAVTVGFMLYAGEPERAVWWVGFVPFALWAIVPFVAVGYVARGVSSSRRSLWVLLVAAVLLTTASSCLLYLAFVAQPDAQSGIVFVFLPLWQLIALIPFLGVAVAWGRGPPSDTR